jgi:MFS transporter, MHS family, alpha-ketoglutarate permease
MTMEVPAGTGAGTAAHRLSAAQRKAVVAGSIGNAVEWVDWAVYATFAPVYAGQFFAHSDETAALLATLVVFAVGFVMRPVGAPSSAPTATGKARKNGMTLTISLMAAASIAIAVCPTYGHIGVLAPLVLLLARLVQGFSAGGEFGSSSAFLIESAARGRRAFAGSWQQVSVGAGTLVASLLGTLLTSTLDSVALHAWGWRLAFAAAGLLGLVGLWLRLSVDETEAFRGIESRPRRNPLAAMLRHHPGAALRVAGVTIAGTLIYYVWISYMPAHAHLATGIPLSEALLANTIAVVVFLILLPFGGLLSDRLGRKPTMAAFAAGFLVLSWPAFHFLAATFWSVLIIEAVGMILIAGYSANCAVIMAEQFPPEVRTTGIALPYALAVALFGGTAPYVTTWLNTHHHGGLVWLYVAAAALTGLAVYLTMPETKGKELSCGTS